MSPVESSGRTGVWLIGARGSVAVTAMVGALAIRAGLASSDGCVTAPYGFLPPVGSLVFGGHDVVDLPLVKKAEALGAAGVLPARLVPLLADELAAVSADVRPLPSGGTQADVAAALVADISDFRARHSLERVIVINVASTEAVPVVSLPTPAALEAALASGDDVLPPSSLAAYAAFTAGCPFVDFTPSLGARVPVLEELARAAGVPFAGNDGKTGETLVKSVLAPMFAARNLRVRTWSGLNLLGGGDGARLTEPGANAAKTASKQRILADTLGYQPQGTTRIDYVEDLGDHKTAWDLITFSGFLGTRMRMEFSWHGVDSALAAPLILDLARLLAGAHRAGRGGPLPELAFFFKDPMGTAPADLFSQWELLRSFIASLEAA